MLSGFKMGHRQRCQRESQRFCLSECTFVMAPHKRATHHVKQGCVQWKSIMLWCIDLYHLDSWQVTERWFWGWDFGPCLIFCDFHWGWNQIYVARTHWRYGTHENTMTAQTDTNIYAVPDVEMNCFFQFAGVALCSQNKIRSALNSPMMQKRRLREAGPRSWAKSKHGMFAIQDKHLHKLAQCLIFKCLSVTVTWQSDRS